MRRPFEICSAPFWSSTHTGTCSKIAYECDSWSSKKRISQKGFVDSARIETCCDMKKSYWSKVVLLLIPQDAFRFTFQSEVLHVGKHWFIARFKGTRKLLGTLYLSSRYSIIVAPIRSTFQSNLVQVLFFTCSWSSFSNILSNGLVNFLRRTELTSRNWTPSKSSILDPSSVDLDSAKVRSSSSRSKVPVHRSLLYIRETSYLQPLKVSWSSAYSVGFFVHRS